MASRHIAVTLVVCLCALIVWMAMRGDSSTPPPAYDGPAAAAESRTSRIDSASSEDDPPRSAEIHTERITAELEATISLTCRVHRGFTDPFPSARIRIETRDAATPEEEPLLVAQAIADSAGTVAWLLPVQDTTVTVTFTSAQPDLGHSGGSLLVPPETASLPPADLYLFPLDHEMQGLVTDRDDRPIPDARVSASFDQVTRTDEGGRFRLLISSATRDAWLAVAARGYAFHRERRRIEGPGVTDLLVRLEPAFRIAGRVTDGDGRTIEGARAHTFFTSRGAVPAVSDAEGRFLIDVLDGKRPVHHLRVEREGFASAGRSVETSPPEVSVEIVLQPGRAIAGRVLDPLGRPAAGAQAWLGEQDSATDPRHRAVTDSSGVFRLRDIAVGEHVVQARRPGCAPARATVNVTAEGPEATVELRLAAPHFVAGRVTDRDGSPASRISVRAVMARPGYRHLGESTTDEDGRYRIDDLPELRGLSLDLVARDFVALRQQPLRLDAADNDLVLDRAGRLRGRVVDARTGQPVEHFRIRVLSFSNLQGGFSASWMREGHTFRDPEGRWDSGELTIPPGSTFTLQALAEGYAPSVLTGVVAERDPAGDAAVFPMARGTELRGRVLDKANGLGLADARVVVMQEGEAAVGDRMDPNARPTTTTASDGSFAFPHVAPGSVRLLVEKEGHSPLRHGPVDVPAEGALELVLWLGGPGRIEGVLHGMDGSTRAGVAVWRVLEDRTRGYDPRSTTTGADGSFALDALESGRYEVWAAATDTDGVTTLWRDSVEVVPDETASIDLRPAGSGAVRGSVVFEGTSEAVAGRVQLVRVGEGPDRTSAWYHVELRDGRFDARGLSPGMYRLAVFFEHDGKPGIHNLQEAIELTASGRPLDLPPVRVPPR